MSGDGTAVDPTGALNGAGQLTTAGEQMHAKWVALRARIDALNAQQPWGNDTVGQQFHEGYLGGDTPAATNTLDVGESLVTAVSLLGPQVTEGVQGTVDLDTLISEWFPKA